MDEARLLLSCAACDWRDIIAPSNVALLLSKCPKCSDMVMIAPYTEQADIPSALIQTLWPKGEIDASEISWADEIVLRTDDAEAVNSYVTRVMPFVVTARVIAEIHRMTDGKVNHSELIDRLDSEAVRARSEFEKLESDSEVPIARGQRASVGFPLDEDEPRRRFLRSYLGGDSKSGSLEPGEGELQNLGLIRVNPDGTIDLDSHLQSFTIDPRSDRKILTFSEHAQRHYKSSVPEWFTEEQSIDLAKAIAKASNKELHWMERILRRVSVHHPTQGIITDMEMTLFLKDGGSAETQNCREHWEREPPLNEKELERLENKIYRQLSSTLGRMRELRLIVPVKRGRRIRYHTSDIGKRLIDEWSKDDEN